MEHRGRLRTPLPKGKIRADGYTINSPDFRKDGLAQPFCCLEAQCSQRMSNVSEPSGIRLGGPERNSTWEVKVDKFCFMTVIVCKLGLLNLSLMKYEIEDVPSLAISTTVTLGSILVGNQDLHTKPVKT